MRRLIIAAALLAGMQEVGAQKIYRCGSDYSHVPCASTDQKVVTTTNADVPSGQEPSKIKEECKSAIRRGTGFFDPGSVQFSDVTKGSVDVFKIHGSSMEARSYYVMVNAKNRYGGYVGERLFTCIVSMDDRRILQVN